MPENDRLNGCLEEINSEFVEREATPRLLMKLSIQLYLAELSLPDTVSIFEVFDVERARSTVHNWVHKADLQPESGQSPDHIAVDETVIQLNDEQYWLYAAADPETNELLHTKFEPTTTKVLAHSFFTELSEKHDVKDAVFLVDGSHSLQDVCQRHGFDFRYEKYGNRNVVERVFREINGELSVSQTVSVTPTQKLLTTGLDRSVSRGISLSEHYRTGTVQDWECEDTQALAQEIDAGDFLHVETRHLTQIMTSSLTGAEVNVADADLENDVIPASYGSFRNANLLSMAMWYAEATGSEALFIGAHSDDFSGCPDCRPALLDAFYNAINLVTNPETESELRHRHGPHSSSSNVQPQ